MQDALAVAVGLPVGDVKINKTPAGSTGIAGEFRAALGQITGFADESDPQPHDGKRAYATDETGAELAEIPFSGDASFAGPGSFTTHSRDHVAVSANPDEVPTRPAPKEIAEKPDPSSVSFDMTDEAAAVVFQNSLTTNLYQVRWAKGDRSAAAQIMPTTVAKTQVALPAGPSLPGMANPVVQNGNSPDTVPTGSAAVATSAAQLSNVSQNATGAPSAKPTLAPVVMQAKPSKVTTSTDLRSESPEPQTTGRVSAERAPMIGAHEQPQSVREIEPPKAREPKNEAAFRPAIDDAPDMKLDVVDGQARPTGENSAQPLSQTSRSLVAAVRENSGWSSFLASPSVQQSHIVRSDSTVLKTLKIQLTPVELGKVELNLRMLDGQMKIEVTVENEHAYRVLAQDKEAILSTVNGLGYKVDSLVVSNPQSESTLQNQSTNHPATDRSDSGASGQSRQRSDRDDEKILAQSASETDTDPDTGSDYDYI